MTDTVISDTEIRTNPIPVLQTAKSFIQGQGSQEGEWYQTIRIPALAFLFSLSLAISFLLPYFVTKHALHCRYHFFGHIVADIQQPSGNTSSGAGSRGDARERGESNRHPQGRGQESGIAICEAEDNGTRQQLFSLSWYHTA